MEAAALPIPHWPAPLVTTASARLSGSPPRALASSRVRCKTPGRARRCCRRRGGQKIRGTQVTELVVENGACSGVIARQNGASVRIEARAVVIADGGFAANPQMVAQYITPRSDRVLARVGPGANGDGIRLAEAAGAAI